MMIKKIAFGVEEQFEKDRCKKKNWLLMKNPLWWGGVLKNLAGSLSDKNSIQSTIIHYVKKRNKKRQVLYVREMSPAKI